jgi:hypothetical protein
MAAKTLTFISVSFHARANLDSDPRQQQLLYIDQRGVHPSGQTPMVESTGALSAQAFGSLTIAFVASCAALVWLWACLAVAASFAAERLATVSLTSESLAPTSFATETLAVTTEPPAVARTIIEELMKFLVTQRAITVDVRLWMAFQNPGLVFLEPGLVKSFSFLFRQNAVTVSIRLGMTLEHSGADVGLDFFEFVSVQHPVSISVGIREPVDKPRQNFGPALTRKDQPFLVAQYTVTIEVRLGMPFDRELRRRRI